MDCGDDRHLFKKSGREQTGQEEAQSVPCSLLAAQPFTAPPSTALLYRYSSTLAHKNLRTHAFKDLTKTL